MDGQVGGRFRQANGRAGGNNIGLREAWQWSKHQFLATYLIFGCVGWGVRLGSESLSGGAAAAGIWKSYREPYRDLYCESYRWTLSWILSLNLVVSLIVTLVLLQEEKQPWARPSDVGGFPNSGDHYPEKQQQSWARPSDVSSFQKYGGR